MFEFDNMPFYMGEMRFFYCQFGNDYKYRSRMKVSKGGRLCLQSTQKKGCPAHITIREFVLSSDYKIVPSIDMSSSKLRSLRQSSLQDLRKDLDSGAGVKTISKFYVSLPTEEAHHEVHSTKGQMSLAQRIHPVLTQKIHKLVSEGVIETSEVKCALRVHVKHMNVYGTIDPNDRAYNPTDKDISNHVYIAKRKLVLLSSLDQENACMKIEAWKKSNPQASFFFRPYKEDSSDGCDQQVLPHQASSPCNTLLYIHQEKWQKELLVKYGNTMSLLDATYKTMKYELPLFFLCVHTNVGYLVVADFIIQGEAERIQEALDVLKSWNPQWRPNYFMTDYSEAELQAIESSFPSTTIYLCDFHREQSWERWVKDHHHGIEHIDQDTVLTLHRNCATAPPAGIYDSLSRDHNYQKAVENLKSSKLWKENEKLREWLNGTWIPISKVSCCMCYGYKFLCSLVIACVTIMIY